MSLNIPTMEMKDGEEMPQIGLGTYTLKGKDCRQAVKEALELGYEHIDTAERYKNESEIGEVIQGYDRSGLFITSKVWPTNLHHEDLINSCEASLDRLGTSYLDLYLIHWPNESIPLEETLDAMKELREEGTVRSIGVSNFTASQLEEAMETSEVPITVNQVEFHPWLYQEELLNFCRENGVILTAYSPIARTKLFENETIQELSDRYEKTPAQIILKWEVQKGVTVIPRSTSKNHLRENLEIFDWQLDTEDIEKIDAIPTRKRLVNFHYADF